MFRILLRMHWSIYFILAVIVLYVGYDLQKSEIRLNEAREAALQGPVPALVDAGDVTNAAFSEAREINVSAQIVIDAIYTVSVSGRRTVDREMTAVFALPQDAQDMSGEVKVVFLLDPSLSLQDVFGKFATGESGAVSPILHVNGVKHFPGGKLGGVIAEAAQKSGLRLGLNVQYVEPFATSRAEGLMPMAGNMTLTVMTAIAAALAAYGGLRFWRSRRGKVRATSEI